MNGGLGECGQMLVPSLVSSALSVDDNILGLKSTRYAEAEITPHRIFWRETILNPDKPEGCIRHLCKCVWDACG